MATNRADTLDPALLRPGRLDRKIEFPMPDRRQKRLIFATITGKMNLSEDVDLEDYVARPDRISGADINAICQEVHFRFSLFHDVVCFSRVISLHLFGAGVTNLNKRPHWRRYEFESGSGVIRLAGKIFFVLLHFLCFTKYN